MVLGTALDTNVLIGVPCLFHGAFTMPAVGSTTHTCHTSSLMHVPTETASPLCRLLILGDLACYDWQGDGVADHIEFFRGWADSSHASFNAVGGNTGHTNLSAGGEVLAQVRNTSTVQQFVRVYSR